MAAESPSESKKAEDWNESTGSMFTAVWDGDGIMLFVGNCDKRCAIGTGATNALVVKYVSSNMRDAPMVMLLRKRKSAIV